MLAHTHTRPHPPETHACAHAGGVGGLVSCVLETYVPGMTSAGAYAEGNAMGKGPVILHISQDLLNVGRNCGSGQGLEGRAGRC